MKHKQLFALSSDAPFDAELWPNLIEFFSKRPNVDLTMGDLETYVRQKACEIIIQDGASSVFPKHLHEALLPKARRRDKHLLVEVIVNQLKFLSPSSDLIVVDPYIFAHNVGNISDYLNVVKGIFQPIIENIGKVRFVTSDNFNSDLYRRVVNEIYDLKTGIVVECKKTADFHDRFWIVDESRGLFVGTSLSGIGRRYALSDYIKDEDTKAIVKALRNHNLI